MTRNSPWPFFFLFPVLFLLAAPASTAQQVRLNVHGPSFHFGSENATNNRWTLGGGGEVLWGSGDWTYGALAGGYYNSVWNLTLYGGLTGSLQVTDWFAVGLGVSAATGYDGDVCYEMNNGNTSCYRLEWARPVTILPLPFLSVGGDIQFRILGFPNQDSGLIHVMVSVALKGRT